MKSMHILWLLAIVMLSSCSKNNINALFNEAKKTDEYVAFTVPKWVIRTVDKNVFDDHLGKNANTESLLSKVNKARVLVQSDKSKLDMTKMNSIVQNITDKKNYHEYLTVRQEDTRTSIVVNEKKDKIRDLLLYTVSDSNVVLLHLESDISIKEFEEGDFFKDINI